MHIVPRHQLPVAEVPRNQQHALALGERGVQVLQPDDGQDAFNIGLGHRRRFEELGEAHAEVAEHALGSCFDLLGRPVGEGASQVFDGDAPIATRERVCQMSQPRAEPLRRAQRQQAKQRPSAPQRPAPQQPFQPLASRRLRRHTGDRIPRASGINPPQTPPSVVAGSAFWRSRRGRPACLPCSVVGVYREDTRRSQQTSQSTLSRLFRD
jgi:hypothetical protein